MKINQEIKQTKKEFVEILANKSIEILNPNERFIYKIVIQKSNEWTQIFEFSYNVSSSDSFMNYQLTRLDSGGWEYWGDGSKGYWNGWRTWRIINHSYKSIHNSKGDCKFGKEDVPGKIHDKHSRYIRFIYPGCCNKLLELRLIDGKLLCRMSKNEEISIIITNLKKMEKKEIKQEKGLINLMANKTIGFLKPKRYVYDILVYDASTYEEDDYEYTMFQHFEFSYHISSSGGFRNYQLNCLFYTSTDTKIEEELWTISNDSSEVIHSDEKFDDGIYCEDNVHKQNSQYLNFFYVDFETDENNEYISENGYCIENTFEFKLRLIDGKLTMIPFKSEKYKQMKLIPKVILNNLNDHYESID